MEVEQFSRSLTVGDLTHLTGVPTATLRSWESRCGFPDRPTLDARAQHRPPSRSGEHSSPAPRQSRSPATAPRGPNPPRDLGTPPRPSPVPRARAAVSRPMSTASSLPSPLTSHSQPDVDGALGLIDLFAPGSQPRSEVNYRRTREGMCVRQVTNALQSLAAPELQLLELRRTASGRPDYGAM